MHGIHLRLACAGLALGLGAAAPALAEDHPDHAAHPAATHPAAHPSMTMSHHGMAMHRAPAVHHTETVHRTVDVQRNVDVHRNVTVNRSEHIHVVGAGARWHPGLRYSGPRVGFSDWGLYGLAAPAPGYGYYRADDGTLLLILLSTGVITESYAIDAGY